jgi:dUTPase
MPPHELTEVLKKVSRCPSAWLVGDEMFAAQSTKVPVMASTNNAVGFELFAAEPTKVPAGGKVVVPVCWAAIPPGTHARIAPKCDLSCQKLSTSGVGVVDSECGDVKVSLFNHSKKDVHVAVGDAVAQTAQGGMTRRSQWLQWK